MGAKPPLLTQTVVSVVCQVESVVAGTPVISRDINTVMHTACIILPFTLIHVCAQRECRLEMLKITHKQLCRFIFFFNYAILYRDFEHFFNCGTAGRGGVILEPIPLRS